jgi:putative phosphoribosyl transferase
MLAPSAARLIFSPPSLNWRTLLIFSNRAAAGRLLAAALEDLRGSDIVILALPRGGVAVGFEIARAFGAPLDVIPTARIGAPGQPEVTIGAIAPGATVLRNELIATSQATPRYLEFAMAEAEEDLQAGSRLYHPRGNLAVLRGRTVIVVDDGLWSGATAEAALASVHRAGASPIVLAIPVGPAEVVQHLAAKADRVVCLHSPSPLGTVGQWYEDFAPPASGEILDLLARAGGPAILLPRQPSPPRIT